MSLDRRPMSISKTFALSVDISNAANTKYLPVHSRSRSQSPMSIDGICQNQPLESRYAFLSGPGFIADTSLSVHPQIPMYVDEPLSGIVEDGHHRHGARREQQPPLLAMVEMDAATRADSGVASRARQVAVRRKASVKLRLLYGFVPRLKDRSARI